jgi:hypothetical protein
LALTDRPENEAVRAYLEVEQLPSWRDSNSPWIVDGYLLSTHPDLCERVKEAGAAAGGEFRYLYGKPVLVAENGVIVAFAAGTHIFCVRLPRADCGVLAVTREDEPSTQPLLRRKQLQREALVAREWTRVDPWAVALPKDEGLDALGELVGRAVAAATAG